MNVTRENYWANREQIRQDITAAGFMPNVFTNNAWQLLDSEAEPSVNWDDWNDDDFVKQRDVITQLFAEINRFYAEQGTKEEPKPEPEKPKPEPKEKPKEKKPTSKTKGELVDILTPEVDIIQQYIKIHGKSRDAAYQHALNLLRKLQKLINTRVIRSTSAYASEMQTIQEQLLRVLRTKNLDRVEIEDLQKYVDIANSEHVSNVTTWIKTFISTYEHRRPEISKARKFLAKAPDVPELQDAKHALDDYINNRVERIDLTESQLNGLMGVL
ncbi:MAG: hypothetical protein E7069_03810 [Bacteroidales bacterium]|nr:hypothetical protein [Bacteroidales bacterium]